ncbi:sigmaY antisigma factor component [Clostridium thermarum]|uniref:sigmaY antisigma factor component n=1 Tax=Clostridium thermarum TaxID=1716543 RepID=UPI0013D8AB3F|nr:sigmaY antisigma factor component [Clostridium thermarum]
MKEVSTTTLLTVLIIVIPLLLIQASWIFQDARKRGEKYYWLWGLFGLINVPQSLIIYLIVTRIILDRNKRK